MNTTTDLQELYGDTMPVAVIGAGCRMPRAADPFEYWRRLADGEELIEFFDAAQLAAAGVDPALLQKPGYVPAAAVLADADRFDWGFFGYSRHEAESIDPQQRLFLMCAWEALEMAGYGQAALAELAPPPKIGVIGSCKMSSYPAASFDKMEEIASPSTFARLIGNDKDYLATRVSYKLGLTGPSLTVQTACSSSLVAIHLACEQIASGECEMVLAGGAGIGFPQQTGYVYREGMIFSPDGHCRPFDAGANGTAIGNGVAVVLLKSLDRALEDGDPILAVVRGSAVNNDGAAKAGYTAPSPEGQARVIGEALALADVDPASIGLVEAHGTATPLGDPIEVEALTRAWRRHTAQSQYCALGSVKSNLGHLDTAAGVASFLKAALALHYAQVPPSLHYEEPNPAIDFASSPFFVPQMLLPWPQPGTRRAAVSSFAIGGTNCHAVLEQAPLRESGRAPRQPLLLLLSARSEAALRTLAQRHAWRLCELDAEESLADYCATSVWHRSLYDYRLVLLAQNADQLIAQLYAFLDGDVAAPAAMAGPVRGWSASALAVDDSSTELLAFVRAQLAQARPDWDGHAVSALRPAARALLPTCPFEGERCWYDAPGRAKNAAPRLGREVAGADAAAAAGGDTALVAWHGMAAAAHRRAEELGRALDLSALDQETVGVDALHAAYVGQAFAQLDLFRDAAEWLDADACLRRSGAPARYRELFTRLLRDHAAGGWLEVGGDSHCPQYRRRPYASLPDTAPWLALMRDIGYSQLADLVERSGPRLAEMLAEKVDPVSVVFPGAATDDVEHMYQEQPYSVYLNRIAAAAVAALAAAGPRPLRILEIGGGTGGTTRDVLAQLPAGRCELYTFTDLGPLFLKRAQKKFAAYPFMRYQPLDMNKALTRQGLAAGGYDLIVAANVLHNAPDLRAMLSNLGSVLAPGGVLLMREITTPKKLFDFVFGPLVPALQDSARRDGELFASRRRWQEALADAGYAQVEAAPAEHLPAHALGEQILLARWPGAAALAVPATPAASAAIQGAGAGSAQEGAGGKRTLSVNRPSQGSILAALLAQLPAEAALRLEQLRWHLDLDGAPDPLPLQFSVAGEQLHAEVDDDSGVPQRLLSARLVWPRAQARQMASGVGASALPLPDAPLPLLDRVLQVRFGAGTGPIQLDTLYWPAPAAQPAALQLYAASGSLRAADTNGAIHLDAQGARPAPSLPAPWRPGGDARLYRWEWRAAAPAIAENATGSRPRVLCLGAAAVADEWVQAFEQAGASCAYIAADTANASALEQALLAAGQADAIIHIAAPPPALPAEAPLFNACGAATLTALLTAQAKLPAPLPLVLLTPQAFAIDGVDLAGAWQSAGLGALLAVACHEMPALRACQFDGGAAAPAEQARLLLPLLAHAEAWAPVYAARGARLLEQRLQPARLPLPTALPAGRHVLVGGLCQLGLELAQWLVAQGARDLAWLTRRAPSEQESRLLDSLRAQGAIVHIDSHADACDAQAFRQALARLAGQAPIGVVFHLAAVVRDAPLSAIHAEDWETTLATKLRPALCLHKMEEQLRPALTVYFSSAATAFGPAGQGAYALANGMLEGLAQHRNRQGCNTLAVAWGFWREIASEARAGLAARLAERGMLGISNAQGLTMLACAMGGNAAVYLPFHADWARFAQRASAAQRCRFAPCLPAAASAVQAPAAPPLAQQLRQRIADLLGCPPEQVAGDAKLIELGLDSLLMLDLAEQIRHDYGIEVSAETLLRADTPDALAAALARQAPAPTPAMPQAAGAAPVSPAAAGETDALAATRDPARAAGAVDGYLRSRLAALLQTDAAAIGADAQLLQLGLDSLLFLELGETVQQELGVRLSAEAAFQAGSVGLLAKLLLAELHPALPAAPQGAPQAASSLRTALQELQQAEGGWLAPNGDVLPRPAGAATSLHGLRALRHRLRQHGLPQQLYAEFDKPASFDLAAFERAWEQVVQRHASLRGTIGADGVLRVLPQAPRYSIPLRDLRGLPSAGREAALAAARDEMENAIFDLAQWPHFEWRASRMSDDSLRIHLRIDTSLNDIESFRIMLRELHLWTLDAQRRLPPLHFSAIDYHACEQALARTQASERQLAAYRAALAALPDAPPLPQLPPGRDAHIAVWREALPRAAWLGLKEQALSSGISGTALLLAVYACALAPWSRNPAFSLRLDYPDRLPLHAQIGNVMLDAGNCAVIGCDLEAANASSFLHLAQACGAAIARRLEADLLDGAAILQAYQEGGAQRPPMPPVAMTSLLGVRSTYAIPETSDPLLGMPSYELATQPATALHFQVLEEESALLYNIDLDTGRLPDELGGALMRRLRQLLEALSSHADAWQRTPEQLLRGAGGQQHG